jgi:glycosyltransferase involved in cell wall biosynthesis
MSSAKNKVLNILYSGLGGPGSVFFALVNADKNKDFDYRVIFCGIEPLVADYEHQCIIKKIPFWYLYKRKGIDAGIYFRVLKILFRQQPEIILLHGASFILPAILYKIIFFRSRIFLRDTQAHHLKSKNDWFWLRWAIAWCRKIIVLTEDSSKGIRKRFPRTSAKKIIIIPNGLDTDKYVPASSKAFTHKITIGMQSRLQKIKDHPTLFRAFALVVQRKPEFDLYLRVAGDGETRWGLENEIKKLKMENRIELCGTLPENRLIKFMQSLDIYVQATLGETMSNSIIQALSCGLPVIASDVWGVNNMVLDGKNGLLYLSGNAEELANMIIRLLEDSCLREKLAGSARKYAMDNFSGIVMYNNYKKAFLN